MKRHLLLPLLLLPVLASANTVYRPGLVQVLFKQGSENGFKSAVSGVPVLASNLVAKAAADSLAEGPEFVPYPLMDRNNDVVNPMSGTKWSWPSQYATFAYEGEMFVTAGTTYTFYGRFDDGSALVVDGALVLLQREDSGYNKQPQVWGDWTAPATGWVPFNAWIWDWSGGKATKDCYYALQFNTASVKNDFGNASKWSRFEDPLDMSLLRSTTDEVFTTLSSFAKNGDDLDITVTAAGLPSSATIAACWGAADAGLSTNAWDHVAPLGSLATNDAGTVTASFTVPGAASAAAMRLYLEGESGTTGYFVEWTEAAATSVDPVLSVVSVDPGYTNATVTVNLSGFGVGATENTLTVEIAASADGFATPVATYAYAGNPATGAGVYAVSGSGLETNTTYWARAVSANDAGGSGASMPVSFTTLNPGLASGVASFAGRGFSTLSATAVVSGFGEGSSLADIRLEASTASDFATLASVSAESAATLDAAATLVCENLAPDTAHYLRLRIVNEWGLVTYVPLAGTFSTRSVPISATGIGYVFAADNSTVDLSFGVSEVFDGATCVATLTYGGRTYAQQSFSAAGPVSWPGLAAASGAATATVTVSATVDGTDYAQTWTATVTPGTRSYALSSLADLRTKIFHVGDSAVLPELTGADDYYVLTDCRAFALDGLTLTALEPGFGGVVAMEYDAGSGAFVRNATMGFGIVVPEPNGSGRVWLCTKTASNGYDWTTAGWENLTDGSSGYPNGADDVAMIAIPGNSTFYVDASVTVGAVYFGFDSETVLPGRATNNSNGDQAIWLSSKNASRLTFAASGKNRALLRLCNFGNRNLFDSNAGVRLGYWNGTAANQLSIVQTGDMDWDCGAVHDYTDTATRDVFGRVRIGMEYGAGWTVPEGRTLHVYNVTGYKNAGDDQGGNAQFWLNPTFPFLGSGEIVYDGPGSTYVNNPFHDFGGTVVVRNKQRYSHFSFGSRGGSFWMVNWSQPWASNTPPANASLTIEGDVGYNNGLALDRSYGVVSYGNAHGYGSWGYTTNALPGRKWILNGGAFYQAAMNNNAATWREDGTTATQPICVRNGAETLCVSNGFSYIYLTQNGDTDRPTNNLEFASLEHAGDGVLVASNDRIGNSYQNGGGGASWRVRLVLGGFHDHAIGGAGAADAIHGPAGVRTNILERTAPIIPWIAAPVEGSLSLYFPGASPEGELVMAGHPASVVLDEVTDPTMNVNVKGQTSLTLTQDRTVNSLRVPNPNGGSATFNLGEGRTLTITSGGLVVGNGSHSRGGIGNEAGYLAGSAGTVVFPNKAYIWTPSQNGADGKHSAIWAAIVSPHGAVFSYPGYLDLGGDQTGIDDHIAVNGTYLKLGSETTGCEIDVPVHLHGAYSTLAIAKQGSFCKQDLHFWDHGTPGSKFVPAAGTEEVVHKMWVDGVSMPRGYYGSSDAKASIEALADRAHPAFVDDRHFSGTGWVKVMTDEVVQPTIMILR